MQAGMFAKRTCLMMHCRRNNAEGGGMRQGFIYRAVARKSWRAQFLSTPEYAVWVLRLLWLKSRYRVSFSACRAELQRPGRASTLVQYSKYRSGPYDFMALTRVASIPGHGDARSQGTLLSFFLFWNYACDERQPS